MEDISASEHARFGACPRANDALVASQTIRRPKCKRLNGLFGTRTIARDKNGAAWGRAVIQCQAGEI